MSNKISILVGLQWGDEGKGKIVDILSPEYNIVARYQGGANAGHTVVINGKKYVLHLIPSGIFTDGIICVIGNGTVIDFTALNEEIELLNRENINTENRILISENAHVILPYHKIIDAINESDKNKIGTTKKGIGPAYFDKYARRGIKVNDFENSGILQEKIENNLELLKRIFPHSDELRLLTAKDVFSDAMANYHKLEKYIADTQMYLNTQISLGKNILLEGAQGALLDIDFGTYPYITSSNPTAGGACTGTGIPPNKITNIIGIVKAYTTRVGEGPFPTELFDEAGKLIAKIGNEFGATTGRPRKCGWLDLVALKYACTINGINELAITKSDVLSDFDEIYACTHYDIEGFKTEEFITNCDILKNAKPVYKKFKGWKSSLGEIFEFENLNIHFKEYIKFIEEFVDVKIKYISTGPARDEIIIRD
jgi:adenylosuccinate synthase